jgi:Zn-dependent peptidase ImmA (M78 family)
MTLPRGFKANAERQAAAYRAKLGLDPDSALDVFDLAKALDVTVVDGGDLVGANRFEELEALQVGVFSAATMVIRGRVVIVTNPQASPGRLRSDVAHELSHLALKHQPSEVRSVGGVTFRTCDPSQEEQATALGGALLLPRPLLLGLARRGEATPQNVAAKYSVSLEMARFRINSTGVLKQAARSRGAQ